MSFIANMFTDSATLHAVSVTFRMGLVSTAISAVLGTCLGLFLERVNFFGKNIIVRINRTMMGVPPVVIGLIVYLLIMRRGPLGAFSMLFTIQGMVLAQILIITPIISGMVHSYAVKTAPAIRVFAKTMGASKKQTLLLLLREMRHEIYFAIVAGFGRAISEVGAVMLVGGNIRGQTRTMTTAIATLQRQGIFQEGIALGVMLLLMAFVLQWLADYFRRKEVTDENY